MNQQSQKVQLTAERRTAFGRRVGQLRRDGWVPGVIYGHGFDSVPLQFEAHELSRSLAHVSGSQLINIQIPGQKESETALVREMQRDPIKGDILHVDFYRVKMTERLTAEIPLNLVGESQTVQQNEGILLQGISSIEVECLPGDLVDEITVDLSDLIDIGQGIYVRDLAIPAGIDVLTDLEEMIVRVVAMEEEEIIEEEAPEMEEIELVGEGEEEGEVEKVEEAEEEE
jgi:large subunit ribosomal protein L25